MNVTCGACGQIVGSYDMCSHRDLGRLCIGCCRDEHRDPTEPKDAA